MEIRLVFKTGAVMVLDFADFLVFDVFGYKCTMVLGEEKLKNMIIGLSAWKGFDFMLDGEENRLGFKSNENCCKFCLVSEKSSNSGNN